MWFQRVELPNHIIRLIFLGSVFFTSIKCEKVDLSNKSAQRVFVRSYYTLSQLALHEMTVYVILKHHAFRLGLSPETTLMRYLEEYEDSSGQIAFLDAKDQHLKIPDHPLLSYRMIYRYVTQLTPILTDLDVPGITDIVQEIKGTSGWPDLEDLEEATNGIVRLQYVYDLDIPKFARGNILGLETRHSLRAHHCLAIGNYALKQRYFAAAVNWLRHARLLSVSDNTIINWTVADASLSYAISIHDAEWVTAPLYDPHFFMTTIESSGPGGSQTRRKQLAEQWRGERDRNFNEINFWNLCSGEDLRTPEEKAELHCWYETESNPVWIIGPLKVEELAKSPYLIQIYDVLSESLIDNIIEESQPSLRYSALYTRGGESQDKVRNKRTSAISWLNETSVPSLAHIPRLIESITGLVISRPNSAEMLHLASYSFGDHYSVHRDILDENENWKTPDGDRVATIMFYLSDVKQGGFTAFPAGGIAARPVKGSAVFWYNMHLSGRTEEKSYHGACPVIMGSKWIATKWIHSHDQFMARPCSTNPDE